MTTTESQTNQPEPRKLTKKQKVIRLVNVLTTWFIYGVLVALVPIFFNFLAASTLSEESTSSLFADGGLLLISTALIGEKYGTKNENSRGEDSYLTVAENIVNGMCFILLLIATLWFAFTKGTHDAGRSYKEEFVAIGSFIILIFSIISVGSSKTILEVCKWD